MAYYIDSCSLVPPNVRWKRKVGHNCLKCKKIRLCRLKCCFLILGMIRGSVSKCGNIPMTDIIPLSLIRSDTHSQPKSVRSSHHIWSIVLSSDFVLDFKSSFSSFFLCVYYYVLLRFLFICKEKILNYQIRWCAILNRF